MCNIKDSWKKTAFSLESFRVGARNMEMKHALSLPRGVTRPSQDTGMDMLDHRSRDDRHRKPEQRNPSARESKMRAFVGGERNPAAHSGGNSLTIC